MTHEEIILDDLRREFGRDEILELWVKDKLTTYRAQVLEEGYKKGQADYQEMIANTLNGEVIPNGRVEEGITHSTN
jgi:hypothetical protein